jgi:hypothetical protein
MFERQNLMAHNKMRLSQCGGSTGRGTVDHGCGRLKRKRARPSLQFSRAKHFRDNLFRDFKGRHECKGFPKSGSLKSGARLAGQNRAADVRRHGGAIEAADDAALDHAASLCNLLENGSPTDIVREFIREREFAPGAVARLVEMGQQRDSEDRRITAEVVLLLARMAELEAPGNAK